jgi:hypothetical protein
MAGIIASTGGGAAADCSQGVDPQQLWRQLKDQLLPSDKVLNKNQRKKARKKLSRRLHDALGVPRCGSASADTRDSEGTDMAPGASGLTSADCGTATGPGSLAAGKARKASGTPSDPASPPSAQRGQGRRRKRSKHADPAEAEPRSERRARKRQRTSGLSSELASSGPGTTDAAGGGSQSLSRTQQKRLARRQAQPEDLLTEDGAEAAGVGAERRGQGAAGASARGAQGASPQRRGRLHAGGAAGRAAAPASSLAGGCSEEVVQRAPPSALVAPQLHRFAPMPLLGGAGALLRSAATQGVLRPQPSGPGSRGPDLSAALLLVRAALRRDARDEGSEGAAAAGAPAAAPAAAQEAPSGAAEAGPGATAAGGHGKGSGARGALHRFGNYRRYYGYRIWQLQGPECDARLKVSWGARRRTARRSRLDQLCARPVRRSLPPPACAQSHEPYTRCSPGFLDLKALPPHASPCAQLMRPEWFAGRSVIDVGCNEVRAAAALRAGAAARGTPAGARRGGAARPHAACGRLLPRPSPLVPPSPHPPKGIVTLAVAARFHAARTTGYDLDPGLIARACT